MGKVNNIDELFVYRTPNTSDPHVGIEIEFYCSLDTQEVADLLFASDIGEYVTLKDDGSIQPANDVPCRCPYSCHETCPAYLMRSYHGHEICVLVKQSEVRDVVARVCRFIRSIGGEVNSSCGLHVHIDMRQRDVRNSYNNLFKLQSLLFSLCPERRKRNNYCAPIKSCRVPKAGGGRYRSINSESLRRHNTLEVRLHHGTVKAKDIICWVNLLTRTVDANRIRTPVETADALQSTLNLTKELKGYVQSRVRLYETQHREAS